MPNINIHRTNLKFQAPINNTEASYTGVHTTSQLCDQKYAKNSKIIQTRVVAYMRIQFFANISKSKGSRAQSCIKCIYKHADSGHFKLKMDVLRPSEAEIWISNICAYAQKMGVAIRLSCQVKKISTQIFLTLYTFVSINNHTNLLSSIGCAGFSSGT